MSDSSTRLILMVCTGNTCRSPMAQTLAAKHLADSNLQIASAGVFASPGAPATQQAIAAMAERGLDLSQHRSQPLTEDLVEQADVIYTMTQSHLDALLAHVPSAKNKASTLATHDIADPYGGPISLYIQTADQIDMALKQRLATLAGKESS